MKGTGGLFRLCAALMLSTNTVLPKEGMEPNYTTAALKVYRTVSKLTELLLLSALKLHSQILNFCVFEVIVWVCGLQLYCFCSLSSTFSPAAAGRRFQSKSSN